MEGFDVRLTMALSDTLRLSVHGPRILELGPPWPIIRTGSSDLPPIRAADEAAALAGLTAAARRELTAFLAASAAPAQSLSLRTISGRRISVETGCLEEEHLDRCLRVLLRLAAYLSIDTEEVVPRLLERISDTDEVPGVRVRALEILCARGLDDPDARSAIERGRASESSTVRLAAATVLGEEGQSILAEILADPVAVPDDRVHAFHRLMDARPSHRADWIRHSIDPKALPLLRAGLEALAREPIPELVEHVAELSEVEDAELRQVIKDVLRALGADGARLSLVEPESARGRLSVPKADAGALSTTD